MAECCKAAIVLPVRLFSAPRHCVPVSLFNLACPSTDWGWFWLHPFYTVAHFMRNQTIPDLFRRSTRPKKKNARKLAAFVS